VAEQYPFFQTARLLIAKNRFVIGDDGYRAEIESAAAFVADRRVLYDLIYPLTDLPLEQATDVPDPVEHKKTDEIQPTLRSNISSLLTLQLQELELIDPAEAELVPEIAIDMETLYRDADSGNALKASDEDPELLILDTMGDDEADSDTDADANVVSDAGADSVALAQLQLS
jgi:hypothetical protein